ncbi:hypothetical protein CIW48_26190 [Methylobacterium sp. P1-11]|nr:hypothetical protein CIW48_26190 [Methylobacterium sp. P1-11]
MGEIEQDLRDAIGMARALDTMLLFGQQESPFQPADYSAALKLLDHLTEDLARLHDDVYALMGAARPAEAEAPCRAASEEKGTHNVGTPDALGPAVLQLPRHAADMSNDVRDTERLLWALLAIFPKEVDVRLCGDEVSGVRQIAWCALERIERLQSDARIIGERDREYWSARYAAGGTA